MTPHDLNPRTFRPGQQGPSSATMVEEEPSSPGASPDGWTDDPQSRGRIVEAIAMLESAATAMGAAALTPADLRSARQTNQLLAEAAGHEVPGRVVELIGEFHRQLYARCANSRLIELIGEEMTLLRAVEHDPVRLSPARLRGIVEEHEQLVDLIATDPTAPTIRYVLRAHRERVCYL
ncbi:hypothetical protein GCM10022251_22340 [Phytohabitans flavus]|nr:FCD domain-containing protein [Phytohabitans flavus]